MAINTESIVTNCKAPVSRWYRWKHNMSGAHCCIMFIHAFYIMKVAEDSGPEGGDRRKRDIVTKQFEEPDDLRYEGGEPQGGDFCPDVSM